MRKQKFYRRWKRSFRAGLLTVQTLLGQCLRSGQPELVHDLRVALRRTRLLVLVGTPVLGKGQVASFRQWALKLATALSAVRDYDVTLEWLKAHSPTHKHIEVLQTRRTRLWLVARPKLLALPEPKWHELRQWDSSTARPGKVRHKFRKESEKLQRALIREAADFGELDANRRHEFRRALRRLRYLRELGLTRRAQKKDRPLKRIIAFQEALGEMQNCHLVREFFTSPSPFNPPPHGLKLVEAQERHWHARAENHLPILLRNAKPL
jgi:CHAD domain-containing protein